MKLIIDRIIEIEKRAQTLIKNAKKEQSEVEEKANAVIEKHRREYLERARKRIEQIKIYEAGFAEEKIAEMKKEHAAKLDSLEKLASLHTSEWADEVYNYIINPTIVS